MDQTGPGLALFRKRPQQFVQRMDLTATALAGKAGRLVECQNFGILEQHEAPNEGGLVAAELDRLEGFHTLL